MEHARFLPGVWILLCSVAALAGPEVIVDTIEARFGALMEDSVSVLSHTFLLKNTGDSTLVISLIKTSCGCTSYENDSLIAPGSTGRIEARLDLHELHGGEFRKYLVVRSNAVHMPRVELGLSGTIKSYIDVDPVSIVLPTMKNKDTVQNVTLATEKADLTVSGVFFEVNNAQASGWQPVLPVKFKFRKNTGKVSKGLSTYTVTLFYIPVEKESRYGKFVLKTNHPKKPEFKISGVLDPR
jgi:hypothetical protein